MNKICFKISVRNIFANISRSLMVIIGVFGCTGLLCCGFGVDDSINTSASNDFNRFFRADVLLYFTKPTNSTKDELDALVDNKIIDAYEGFGYLPTISMKTGFIDNPYNTYVYSLDVVHESDNHFFDLGYTPKDTKVAISQKIANNLNLGIGNIINFEVAGDSYSGTVDKIINNFYIHGIFIDGAFPGYPTIEKYPTASFIRFNPNQDQAKVLEELKQITGVGKIINKEDLFNAFNNGFSTLNYVTLIVKVFALILAFVAIYNLALLSFEQNIQNIATQKILGLTRWERSKTFFFETIILTTIGGLLGLTLAYPLTNLLLYLNSGSMFEFTTYIAPTAFLFSLAIILVASIISICLLALKQRKIKMVESLKTIE